MPPMEKVEIFTGRVIEDVGEHRDISKNISQKIETIPKKPPYNDHQRQ